MANLTTLLDALLGGTVRDLERLADDPPVGAAAFAAWHELEAKLGLRNSADPVATAAARADPATARVLVRVVDAIARQVEAALRAGQNDPIDAMYLRSAFPRSDVFKATALLGWLWAGLDGWKDWSGNGAAGLVGDHPLRALELPRMPGIGPYVVLAPPTQEGGASKRRWFRHSDVVKFTAYAVEHERREERERERAEAAEHAQKLEQARHLENQARRLRGELV